MIGSGYPVLLIVTFLISTSREEETTTTAEPVVVKLEEIKVYQRQFRIILETGQQENCFTVEVDLNQHLNMDYTVLNSDPNNARPYYVNLQIREERTKNILYNYISSEMFNWDGFQIYNSEPLEICFINLNPREDSKVIAFQVSIVGKPDDTFRLGSDVGNAYVVEATSEEMRRSASQLIVNLINGQGSLWNIRGSQMQTFLRMEALAQMIETWSMVHAAVVIGVSLTQVFVLKRMFSDPRVEKSRLKVRT